MGRYYGKIGYAITQERMTDDNPPRPTGIFEHHIIEKPYYGETQKFGSTRNQGQDLIDDLRITTSISILADAFAYQNFSHIVYAEVMGVKWKVTQVTPDRPRILLTLGGEYHGEED